MASTGLTIGLIKALAKGGIDPSQLEEALAEYLEEHPEALQTDVQINSTSITSQGVANVPIATSSNLGVVKENETYGIKISSGGEVRVSRAADADIKAGTQAYKPIVAENQHKSAFYALAKAAGADLANVSDVTVGTYPDAQKVAIQKMLGVDGWVTVELDATDYDADSKSLLLDVGTGNEIKEVRFVGQYVWDTAIENPYIRAGFGNEVNTNINDFLLKQHSGTVNRVVMHGQGINMCDLGSNNYRTQFGYGYYGTSNTTGHALNVDISSPTALGKGTKTYHQYNNPRYFHIGTQAAPDWAYFKVQYILR